MRHLDSQADVPHLKATETKRPSKPKGPNKKHTSHTHKIHTKGVYIPGTGGLL